MANLQLEDDAGPFEVIRIAGDRVTRVVLFAAGGGGDPQRHLRFLTALAKDGCAVVAPRFARLAAPTPTEAELVLRARRLTRALDSVASPGLPVAGVGHSIGGTILLALAGGVIWMGPERRLSLAPEPRLERLVLLAPATGFFQAPGALDRIQTPLLTFAGTKDVITPPSDVELLQRELGSRVRVHHRVVESAGHFSFMNEPPPGTTEPLPDRDRFLDELAAEVCRFIS
jgi:pimeloyl-ACP methyl ester carboxylesterase